MAGSNVAPLDDGTLGGSLLQHAGERPSHRRQIQLPGSVEAVAAYQPNLSERKDGRIQDADYQGGRPGNCRFTDDACADRSCGKPCPLSVPRPRIVVGADKMSSITDYTNRETCVLFGDGAGALLLEPTTEDVGINLPCSSLPAIMPIIMSPIG